MQIVTTLGYGDFTVDGQGARVFISFYLLSLLVFAAFTLGFLQKFLLAADVQMLERRAQRIREELNKRSRTMVEQVAANHCADYQRFYIGLIIFFVSVLLGALFFYLYE